MIKIEINNYDNDNFNYYLLTKEKVPLEEVSSLLKAFTNSTKFVRVTDGGVEATDRGYWVVKRTKENVYVDLLNFENDSKFMIP